MKPSRTPNTLVSAGGRPILPTPTEHQKPHAKAGEVRIIGGAFKRSKLAVPIANGLRPTSARVRETLFNWLGQDLSGQKCLDAFAGCGALGFEAASRGASTTWLVERERLALQALHASQAKLNMAGLRVVAGDALSLLGSQKGAGWDVIFLDPPFDGEATCQQAVAFAAAALATDGHVYLEAPRQWHNAELMGLGLHVVKHGKAGAVHFHLLAQLTSGT